MKKLLFINLFFIFLISCHNEEFTNIPESNISIETIDPGQDEKLKELINLHYPLSAIGGRTVEFHFGSIDFTKAEKLTVKDKNLVRYSLRLHHQDDAIYFENVIFRDRDGDNYAYITRYEPDPDWLVSQTGKYNAASFTGKVYILDLNRNVLVEGEMVNGIGHPYFYGISGARIKNCENGVGTGSGGGGGGGDYDDNYNGGGSGSGGGGGTDDGGGTDSGSDSDSGTNGTGGQPCRWYTVNSTGNLIIDCPGYDPIVYGKSRRNCETPPFIDVGCEGNCSSGENKIPVVEPEEINLKVYLKKQWEAQIDGIANPNEKRKEQLNYIATHNAQAGRDFKNDIEFLLSTPGLTLGEVSDINNIVNEYWEELVGRLIMAHFYPVAEAAKPFIELALIETGSGVLFQAVKGLLSVKWGVQLAKIGVNTTSVANVVNRLKSGLSFAANNSSLTLKIGGRNLVSSSVSGSKSMYKFSDITKVEAEAIFSDMTAGRAIKTITTRNGIIKRVGLGNREFIQIRRFSEANLGETTIEFKLNSLRSGYKIELKFLH